MPDPDLFSSDTNYGPEDLARESHLTDLSVGRLLAFDDFFLARQAQMNLVARSTVETRWARHYRDSAQLHRLVPEGATTLVDMGSGAGFPGLILAAMAASRPVKPGVPDGERKVTLVESIRKKAAFLSEASEIMGLAETVVIPDRVENLDFSGPDVITARAMAPLVKLCGYAAEIAGPTTICLFPKGQDVERELTEATKSWNMDVEQHTSLTNPASTILAIRHLRPKRR